MSDTQYLVDQETHPITDEEAHALLQDHDAVHCDSSYEICQGEHVLYAEAQRRLATLPERDAQATGLREALDGAAREAHLWSPDHRGAFEDCSYEPCRLRRAALSADPDAAKRDAVVEAARLVAQWHNAIGSGPIEVLNAELGDLKAKVDALLAENGK